MKKGLLPLTLAVLMLAACGGKQTDATPAAQATDSIAADSQSVTQEKAYLATIERYLVDEIGKNYAPGEHCIPTYTIVDSDESKTDDILVWGDFWVFNYNLVGDTLKCVSGGSHAGLMHLRQMSSGYEVTSFDQVEDGARNLPSAKQIFGDKYDAFHAINSNEKAREGARAKSLAVYAKTHSLSATMYQDYGWPAKKLE